MQFLFDFIVSKKELEFSLNREKMEELSALNLKSKFDRMKATAKRRYSQKIKPDETPDQIPVNYNRRKTVIY